MFVCSFVRSRTFVCNKMPCGSTCELSCMLSCALSISWDYTQLILYKIIFYWNIYVRIISDKYCVLFEVEHLAQEKPQNMTFCLFVCLTVIYLFLFWFESDFSGFFLHDSMIFEYFQWFVHHFSSLNFWWLICATKRD